MTHMSTIKKHDDDAAGSKKKHKPHATQPTGNFGNVVGYLQGVKTEWTRVSWPSWPQIWGQTIVVIVMTTIVTLGMLVIDHLFKFLISGLLHILPPNH